MTKKKFGLFLSLGKLRKDERGSVILQFTFTLIGIMGFIGLVLDGGRLLMVHSDLQKLADAAALAGAAQLNGTANAITNATNAANNMGDSCSGSFCNIVRWADSITGVKI